MINSLATQAPPAGDVSIAHALISMQASGVSRLDAQSMLSKLLGQPRAWLIAHDDTRLTQIQQAQLVNWIDRHAAGEPLAYLLGEQEFYGLKLRVTAQVLIPRPDTEALVDWALELLAGELSALSDPQIVDLGTGSGAIALAIKHQHASASVTAVDVSDEALEIARGNARALGLSIALTHGHWWSAVAGRRFHLALSNPPYIAPGDEHLADLQHEPQGALISSESGLSDLHQIIDGASEGLEIGGWLLLEHGHDQAAAVRRTLENAGFEQIQTRFDLAGHERCTGGRFIAMRQTT